MDMHESMGRPIDPSGYAVNPFHAPITSAPPPDVSDVTNDAGAPLPSEAVDLVGDLIGGLGAEEQPPPSQLAVEGAQAERRGRQNSAGSRAARDQLAKFGAALEQVAGKVDMHMGLRRFDTSTGSGEAMAEQDLQSPSTGRSSNTSTTGAEVDALAELTSTGLVPATVPDSCGVGDSFIVTAANGEMVEVTVPPGVQSGQVIHVRLPSWAGHVSSEAGPDPKTLAPSRGLRGWTSSAKQSASKRVAAFRFRSRGPSQPPQAAGGDDGREAKEAKEADGDEPFSNQGADESSGWELNDAALAATQAAPPAAS